MTPRPLHGPEPQNGHTLSSLKLSELNGLLGRSMDPQSVDRDRRLVDRQTLKLREK